MLNKVILHIGFHKTGSSSLQSYLFSGGNHQKPFDTIFPTCSWLNNADLAWACFDKHFGWIDKTYNFNEVLSYYKRAIAKSLEQGRDVVISSEEFCRLNEFYDPMFFVRLLDVIPFDLIKVISYIRDPFDFLISRYCHEVLYGEKRGFATFLEDEIQTSNFLVRMKPWMDNFPSENVVVREYLRKSDKAKQKLCVIDDFCTFFDYPRINTQNYNVGLGVDLHIAEILADLNNSDISVFDKKKILNRLVRLPYIKTSRSDLFKELFSSIQDELLMLSENNSFLVSNYCNAKF
jgi:hypothetical protein